MVIKLQISTIKKSLSDTSLAVLNLDSALKKDKNYYLQVFWNECKYIEKEVIRHFTKAPKVSFDESHDSHEEQINFLRYFF